MKLTVNSELSLAEAHAKLDSQWNKHKFINLTIEKAQRTLSQNNAIHLYCEMLAEALNDGGWDMLKVLKPGAEIPWSMEKVKENLWKAVQKEMFDFESTTKLNTAQVSEVYDVMNRHVIAATNGVSVMFPSREGL